MSNDENRTLSGMPGFSIQIIKEGSFDESFENFLCDQFFLRGDIVDLSNTVKHLFSVLTTDELLREESEEAFVPALIEADSAIEESETADQTQTSPETQAEPEETESRQAAAAVSASGDSVGVWLDHSDGSRTQLLSYSSEDVRKAAESINDYAALLPENGRMNVLFVPRAQTVNRFALHTDTESGWSSDVEPMLMADVSGNVTVFSAYDIFKEPIRNGEYVYFRTDHHWTARGAYLAADAMLKEAGYQTIPLADYTEKSMEGYLGSIYLHGRNAKLKELADTIEVFYPLLPAKSYRVSNAYKKGELPVIDDTQTNYLVFLGGTHGPYRLLEGGYHTGRNMLLICDSFGNSIAPFFLPYYDNVYLVDFRDAYYSREAAEAGVAEYVKRCDISDIYLVLSETNGIGTNYINRIMPYNIN
ncbi:MAG: hypothetical protein LLF75_08600 [Eubacteriales bacterium]|nr:hypothetical protein [Eubacteriales bacterium]